MSIDIEAVRVAAGSTPDPEVRCSIAELGLLDEITVEGSGVTVHYHLTSPLCPAQFATKIGQEIRCRVMAVPGVEACEVVIQDHFLRDEIQQQINRIPGRRGKGQSIITREVDP
jgi:metal-sulfur cluster biosynthetic enzyme